MRKILKSFVACSISGLALIATAHQASAALWTYSAPNPVSVTVAEEGAAMVQYTVTNQSVKPKALVLQPIPGLSASTCYLQTRGSTCTLTLFINGGLIPPQGIHSGPVLCEHGNSNQCYQPDLSSQLQINRSPLKNRT